MNQIITIAKNTFKECIRDRILYSIVGFALLFVVSTIFFGSVSLGEDIKIIRNFGLAGIYLFSIIITVFIGTSLINKEIEKRTIYITLARPISATSFILGKFLGLLFSMILIIAAMAAVYLSVVASKGGGFDNMGLIAIAMTIPEIAIFIALTLLFSTFSTPLAGTLYSIIVLYIGHTLNIALKHFAKSEGIGFYLFKGLYYLLPNLEKFNLRNLVVYDLSPSWQSILWSIIYGIFYTSVILILASWKLKNEEM